MKKSRNFLLLCSLLLIFASMAGMFVGCGGGGGSDNGNTNNPDQTLTSNLQLSKSVYNFGNVTLGNTATLSVIISNTGTKNLSVTELTLSDYNNFSIDPSECGSGPCTVAAGMSCAIMVTFSPTVEGSYSEMLSITSDDADTPINTVTLTGDGKTISTYSVALNQVEPDCSTDTVTAYVSVTDQEGFAVTGLTIDDFSIKEDGGTPIVPESMDFAKSASFPLSVAILMDYSGSVYAVPDLLETIENSVSSFVQAIGANDQAEIIKFATSIQRTQEFTADKELLDLAIYQEPVNIGGDTALYDAIYLGIDDTAIAQTDRRAVLVLTDGYNCIPTFEHIISEVVGLGKDLGVPVFTVGIGTNTNADLLKYIAAETGGISFDSPDTDRLQTVYSQLSKILNNQYVLTYSSVGTGADVSTIVSLTYDTADGGTVSKDSNALTYPSCP